LVALLGRELCRDWLRPITDALGVDLARILQLDAAAQRLAAEDGGLRRRLRSVEASLTRASSENSEPDPQLVTMRGTTASGVAGSRRPSPSGGSRTGALTRSCGDRYGDQSEHQWMHWYGVPRLDGDWQVGKPAIEDGPQYGGAA
jgi:hypothetical protein